MDSEYEFHEGCRQMLYSSSLSTERGKIQKTCQLIWLPLLPAIALLIYSSIYLVRDVTDYTTKVGHLHNSRDIEASASCLESIRRIQTLRYTSTLYLGSGSAVHSFGSFVDDAFLAAIVELSEATATDHQPCDFARLINEYFSEINFGQTDIDVDDETPKKFCTLTDFLLESLSHMRKLNVDETSLTACLLYTSPSPRD